MILKFGYNSKSTEKTGFITKIERFTKTNQIHIIGKEIRGRKKKLKRGTPGFYLAWPLSKPRYQQSLRSNQLSRLTDCVPHMFKEKEKKKAQVEMKLFDCPRWIKTPRLKVQWLPRPEVKMHQEVLPMLKSFFSKLCKKILASRVAERELPVFKSYH